MKTANTNLYLIKYSNVVESINEKMTSYLNYINN